MNDEQREILREFRKLLIGPTVDGQNKRAAGTKPLWKHDPDHLAAAHRHMIRGDLGELVDPDSGHLPWQHAGWRLLAYSWQVKNGILLPS